MQNTELRNVLFDKPLAGMATIQKKADNDGNFYVNYLKYLETQDQFRSIKRLCQKISRQRKELEMWAASRQV